MKSNLPFVEIYEAMHNLITNTNIVAISYLSSTSLPHTVVPVTRLLGNQLVLVLIGYVNI